MRNLVTTLNFYGGYNQLATYWQQQSDTDDYGQYLFDVPVLLNVYWEDKQEMVITGKGENRMSKATVFIRQAVSLGDYLALGDQTGTTNPKDLPNQAFLILQAYENRSLTGFESFYSAVL